jgi:hypothetical protein
MPAVGYGCVFKLYKDRASYTTPAELWMHIRPEVHLWQPQPCRSRRSTKALRRPLLRCGHPSIRREGARDDPRLARKTRRRTLLEDKTWRPSDAPPHGASGSAFPRRLGRPGEDGRPLISRFGRREYHRRDGVWLFARFLPCSSRQNPRSKETNDVDGGLTQRGSPRLLVCETGACANARYPSRSAVTTVMPSA